MNARVLLLDIETSPKVAYVWRFFKENIAPKQVLDHGHIMSFAARWLGTKEVIYKDNRDFVEDYEVLERLIPLLDEADFVIAHNGERFDLKQIRGRALVNGFKPFSPVKVIDTLLIAKKEFGFASNSLEYLANILGVQAKKNHKKFPGFLLWAECLKNNEEAWEEMKEYNIGDIDTLEDVYLALRPWATQHPNVAVYAPLEQPTCPKCGGIHLHKRGFAFTNVGKYQRYQCQDCGGWSRSRYQEGKMGVNLLANAVG